ncbi:MAG: hypothetical protein J0I41_17080 [Filimonas sp.]|nr:hypothetical protein [Filimonas sp.]
MKKSVGIALFFLISCRITQPIPSSVGVVPLDNYFIKNTSQLIEDVNYIAIRSPDVFYNTFGVAKTMTNEVRTPNFSGQFVVAVAMKPTNKDVTIRFSKAELSGRQMNVYYTVTENPSLLSYKQTPLAVATIPKGESTKEIVFYFKESKIAAVSL